jgi:3-hydroxyisobutyrate dehydrogenase-like beta-hydroxyacid dehydrogenase
MLKIALIGYGEVGQILGQDLKGKAIVSVYDKDPTKYLAATHELVCHSLESAVHGVDIIISAVTADNVITVAENVAPFVKNQLFFDMNSAAPHTKQAASRLVNNYIEGAVMSPVKHPRIAAPTLAGGERVSELVAKLNPLGFKITEVSKQVGVASATKLCRSIVIKGLEVIMVDALKAATHYNVIDPVFASLDASYPAIDWLKLAHDMQERVETHGRRRSAEMFEAADMVAHAGFAEDLVKHIAKAQLRGVKP